MKKLIFMCAVAVSGLLISCEGNTKTEDVGVGAGKGVEAIEALADTTMKENPEAAKDSSLACTCEHGCKTKEECVKHCGEGCGSLKK